MTMWGFRTHRRFQSCLLGLTLLMCDSPASAQDEAGFQAYLPQLKAQAAAAGVTAGTIDSGTPVCRSTDANR